MYLKSLVLKGFKSFADRSALALEPGITAVVGPNGSGKSNISDAVLWVLGERNAKNLRGQAMEDVIFAGSSARKATGLAEVDLVLDNSDGTLPVDFAEVAITRRMYRSGESEYLINGVVARRMDVLDILHDTGLGTGTHSIISQGSLDSILQSKPEDRRALIEEAAGVLKHKQRKAKSERKLEHMDQHLARVKDVAAEVERQLGPLERKAKRARAYQGLSAELSELTLALAVDDLRVLQRAWDEAVERERALDEELVQKKAAIAEAEARAEERAEDDGDVDLLHHERHDDQGCCRDGGHADGEAVETVDEIDGVGDGDDPDDRDGDGQPAEIEIGCLGEDVGVGDELDRAAVPDGDARGGDLDKQLRQRLERHDIVQNAENDDHDGAEQNALHLPVDVRKDENRQ